MNTSMSNTTITDPRGIEMLEEFDQHIDGTHWGVSDWYPEIEEAIRHSLDHGLENKWTTGWMSCKKELLSTRITHHGGDDPSLCVEVSVTDDLDTTGYGEVWIDYCEADDLAALKKALDKAHDLADENQRVNRCYIGYRLIVQDCATKDGDWVDNYLICRPGFEWMDAPTGDYYHEWGWQDMEDSHVESTIYEQLTAMIETDKRDLSLKPKYVVEDIDRDYILMKWED